MVLDFTTIIVTCLLTSVISGGVNLGLWGAVKRSIELRDKKLADMEKKLTEMGEVRIKNIEDAMARRVSRELCEKEHQQLNKRLEEGSGEFRDHGADITLLKTSNAVIVANLKLIMSSMHLTWTEHPK